ncbi:sulfatase [Halobacterium salinarum]|uniref:sulfatase n=1 Tax=Halobacterium salinarum TaxID=2242 RepID=UPI001F404894|nr:sulfatase [Halobacterium salinarum]MCF2165496.1 sulfatase [Halobacterium salinarum]MCF2166684.1 sulfatase [Halobacterium salinarum]
MTEEASSIALVVLDTLRKDHFDRHFDWLPGRRFENTYSTSQWTVPAHASLFTGMYASELGVHSKNLHFNCSNKSIAEILSEHGYTTRAFSANPNVSGHFDFDRGFNLFESPSEFRHLNSDQIVNWQSFVDTSPYSGFSLYAHGILECIRGEWKTIESIKSGIRQVLKDESIKNPGGTQEGTRWVRQQEFSGSEFLFMNLMEAHEPYEAPEEYLREDSPELTNSVGDLSFEDNSADRINQNKIQEAYDSCVRYLSDQYQQLFAELSDSFDYIITLADHGEMLGEHNAWGHEHGVYPELIHVPLVISGEGLSGRCDNAVSLVDVYTTILELAGIDHSYTSRGQSLLNTDKERDILAEYTGLTPWSEERLQESDYSDSLVDKYDEKLYAVATPDGSYAYQTGEGINVTGEEIDDPEERIQRIVRDLDTRDVDDQDDDIPDDVRQQLKDLGYA